MPIRGVILDVDGTLVDSNDQHARSWVDATHEAGFEEISFVQVRPLIGMGGDKVLPALTKLTKDDPRGKRIAERSGEIFRSTYLPRVRAFPKVRELLERIRDDGLALVVATSSKKENLSGLLRAAGVEDLIDEATTASDAKASKPEPDIVEAAIARAGLPASELIMLGDTPYDVDAATRAGIRIIAVRCGGWWADDALAGATAIYDDPAELLKQYDESPLAIRVGR
jgi:HAD superfamily hydrolase (TIGR01509 family)